VNEIAVFRRIIPTLCSFDGLELEYHNHILRASFQAVGFIVSDKNLAPVLEERGTAAGGYFS
jgi:hypothetical protein